MSAAWTMASLTGTWATPMLAIGNLEGFPSRSAIKISPFQNSPQKDAGLCFLPKWTNSRLIFRWRRMILNHCSKLYYWPFERFSKSSFRWSSPIFQEVLDISQIAIAFHRIWPTPFISDLIATILLTYLPFTRRTALSAMPIVSDRWSVDVRWFHDKTSHAIPNSIRLSVYTTVSTCDGSNNFNKFFRLMWGFSLAQTRLNPFSCKILHHDSVPGDVVSGFNSLIEDFVICRNQVSKLFCAR